MTRTGASSGPSKRYCRVFGGVSLTPRTLSRLTNSHTAGEADRPDASSGSARRALPTPNRLMMSLSGCTGVRGAACPAGRARAWSTRRRAASFVSSAADCSQFAAKRVAPPRRPGRPGGKPYWARRSAPDSHALRYVASLTCDRSGHRADHPTCWRLREDLQHRASRTTSSWSSRSCARPSGRGCDPAHRC